MDKSDLENAKLIRLNDVYTKEITKFNADPQKDSCYSIKADVKTDINGDTIVILYIGYKGEKDKTQLFIKPEKLQLSNFVFLFELYILNTQWERFRISLEIVYKNTF